MLSFLEKVNIVVALLENSLKGPFIKDVRTLGGEEGQAKVGKCGQGEEWWLMASFRIMPYLNIFDVIFKQNDQFFLPFSENCSQVAMF